MKEEIEGNRLQLRKHVGVERVHVCNPRRKPFVSWHVQGRSPWEGLEGKCGTKDLLEQAKWVWLVLGTQGFPSTKIFIEPKYGQ